MGTIYQGCPPLIQDLKVTIQSSSLVFPPQESERKCIFLSNIDQILNFNVETLHFFAAHPDFPRGTVAEKIKGALRKALVPYEFLAGRLKLNPENNRFEFDCNGAGAGFVEAESEFTLDDIGDLVYPNPAFEQLVVKTLDILKPDDDQPLCMIQVTTFKCGGFAMGVATNHATFDGLSFKTFLQNLSALAADKPLSVIPCNDRQLLAARSPPRVTFPHHELFKLNMPSGHDHDQKQPSPTVFEATPEDLDFKIFRLSSDDLDGLKEKAKDAVIPSNGKRCNTGFNVITAHIWKCKALSNEAENNLERMSTILYAVDIRSRLSPPLPTSYTGNAVLTAYATAKCKDIEEVEFSKLVEMVSEGAGRITDEYARSAIDWGEMYKGFPKGEVLVSSWWRLGFSDVEYPWGKPRYSCPLVYHRKDIILLFPHIDDPNSNNVNVLVALPPKEMLKFQTLFHKFLA